MSDLGSYEHVFCLLGTVTSLLRDAEILSCLAAVTSQGVIFIRPCAVVLLTGKGGENMTERAQGLR